jgi:hypothetical protein
MQASLSFPISAQHWVSGPGFQGFSSSDACVTRGGHGFDSRLAPKCPVGSWNAAGNRNACTQCGVGLSTQNAAAAQVSVDNCTLAPGYGWYSSVQLCPVGE